MKNMILIASLIFYSNILFAANNSVCEMKSMTSAYKKYVSKTKDEFIQLELEEEFKKIKNDCKKYNKLRKEASKINVDKKVKEKLSQSRKKLLNIYKKYINLTKKQKDFLEYKKDFIKNNKVLSNYGGVDAAVNRDVFTAGVKRLMEIDNFPSQLTINTLNLQSKKNKVTANLGTFNIFVKANKQLYTLAAWNSVEKYLGVKLHKSQGFAGVRIAEMAIYLALKNNKRGRKLLLAIANNTSTELLKIPFNYHSKYDDLLNCDDPIMEIQKVKNLLKNKTKLREKIIEKLIEKSNNVYVKNRLFNLFDKKARSDTFSYEKPEFTGQKECRKFSLQISYKKHVYCHFKKGTKKVKEEEARRSALREKAEREKAEREKAFNSIFDIQPTPKRYSQIYFAKKIMNVIQKVCKNPSTIYFENLPSDIWNETGYTLAFRCNNNLYYELLVRKKNNDYYYTYTKKTARRDWLLRGAVGYEYDIAKYNPKHPTYLMPDR